MREIRAYRSLNGTIYESKEKADEGDKKWIDQKLADDLEVMFQSITTPSMKMKAIAEQRIQVRALFDKYEEMAEHASSMDLGS